MPGKGYNIPEDGHICNILPAVSINGGANTAVFSMRHAGHVDILISVGVSNDAFDITVEECDDFTPTNHPAIAFHVYKEETASGDTLAARTDVTDAGFTTSANDNIFYVISLDASELSRGYPNVRVCFSNPGGATYVAVMAVLSGYRFKSAITPTEIA
jgi:hypothetical protein